MSTRDGLPPETRCQQCGARERELICHLCKTERPDPIAAHPAYAEQPAPAEACTDLDTTTHPKGGELYTLLPP